MIQKTKIIIANEETNIRIDKFIKNLCLDISRNYIQTIIKDGKVSVNGKSVKPSYLTRENDEITIEAIEAKPLKIEKENIALDILFEDESVLIVNKPKGMVVHPAAGHYNGTLVNALMYHCEDSLSDINGVLRPGIVHRIDKNTTGALIVCKNNKAHNVISEQLKNHSINRRYIGLVKGNVKNQEGKIEAAIGRDKNNRLRMAVDKINGKNAVTHYKVLEYLNGATLMEFKLETGRTHQIRVHMSSIGHSLLGDSLYGETKFTNFTKEQCLHAKMIGFIHPVTIVYMEFHAKTPLYMIDLHRKLGGKLDLDLLNGDGNE